MRRVHRPVLGMAAGALLALSACTGGSGPAGSASPTPSEPTASSPATSAAPSADGSASPSLATLPAAQCLTGRYTLVRFVAASNQTYGTGQGGDVTIAFDDGKYTLTGSGKKPIELTLAGNTGKLTVDGRAEGTYALKDSTATFTPGSASGSGTVALGGGSRRLTMDQVTSVIGLQGDGQVACTSEAMTITLTAVRLELGRV